MNNIYILLHGAWHASWCWQYVTPLLQKAGHTVVEHDFAGHGKNPYDFLKISLTNYINELTKLSLLQSKPVILVAHSFAGVIASQVAEDIPDKIKKIIYISAVVPEHNHSLLNEFQALAIDFSAISSSCGQTNELVLNLGATEKINNFFYHLCDEPDVNFALKHLQKEPLLPFRQVVSLSEENFGRVEKSYIVCTEDHAIAPEHQLYMAHKAGIHNIVNIPSDHSPFFSMPNELVTHFFTDP